MNRNQIAAYDDMRASGKAATQRDQIKAFLAKARAPLLRDEIAGRLGLSRSTVMDRLAKGWSAEKALSTEDFRYE